MKRLLFVFGIVCLLMACDNGGMENTLQKEIEESFNADNPFLGTWVSIKPQDNPEGRYVFSDDNMFNMYSINDERNPVFYAKYSFDENTLMLSDIFNGVDHIGTGIVSLYYFTDSHILHISIFELELKKISVKF
jgi:hypothetical protein